MEIRIRRASEGTSKHLTTSSLDKLDAVIPTIKRWGIADVAATTELSGQIWVDPTEDSMDAGRAYFEVVIRDDE
jgi:hypothetical protein